MIIITESCCRRQRVSFKIAIHSRVYFIAPYIHQCKQSGNFAFLLHISISQPMDYFEFFSAYLYL